MVALTENGPADATIPAQTLLRARTQVLLALAVIILGYLARGWLPGALHVWPESLHLPLLDAANVWPDELFAQNQYPGPPLHARTRDLGDALEVPMRYIQDILANGWNYVDAEGNRATLPPLPWLVIAALFAAASWLVSGFRQFPEAWTMTSSDLLARTIEWLNGNLGWAFEAFHTFTTLWLLRPLLDFLQGIGWFAMAVALVLLGFAVGRPRLSILSTLTVLTIAAIGYWDLSMITLHLVIAGTLLSLLIGVPVGILAAFSPRVHSVTSAIVTMLQTLPSFVYLIPIEMLLGPGDVSGMLAIAIYAMATTIRYVPHALKEIDPAFLEAAHTFGASPWQTFFMVRLPLAWPSLILALNQTLTRAVGMVVITALIGSRGLELETIDAIAKVEAGRSLMAGLTISALAILIDRFLNAAATRGFPGQQGKTKG